MLHDVFGVALICMGALTMIARVMARSTELRRRPSQQSPRHSSQERPRW